MNAGAQIIATLLKRIFRSYPMMMLRYNTLPPFIHPQWISSPGEKNYLEPLTNCMSLVHMISAGVSGGSKLFWRNVRQECDRLCEEHTTFDKWQLLAATQALLMYMLMRLAEGETEHNNFDIPLLSAMMIMLNGLRSSLGCQASGFVDHDANWKDWIFEESRQRLGLLLRIISMVVIIEPTAMCHMRAGLILAPLPARKALWEASDEEKWTLERNRDVGNKSEFGLTDDGELVSLDLYVERSDETPYPEQLESAKLLPRSSTNWEEWCSGMDGFGAIVMLAASLPR
ncbi:hypothetical protein K505DRAFT_368494 [Melanomma pulvis-pyrius CBS 109.77]|uniref:Transcription factor domain-containing protein n=1 Tax=Melanomma pulvis-pyrius CBS 109.77 TaxID=1314802 RepID=A0A6A6WPU6_9PLEO|nr:hypothetical protein K505DRAFT_368494 [Melanomma pulvis-pyrius CBS 109.77]